VNESAADRAMRVRWLRQALQNLDNIATYIAEDDPAAADDLVAEIEDVVGLLARHALLGKPGRVPGTRELVIAGTPFIVAYRVVPEEVQILRVLHGAQRWPSSL
jgi:addiction module RelE/StbE family toxin